MQAKKQKGKHTTSIKHERQADANQDSWHTPIKCCGNPRETVDRIVKIIEQNYYLFRGWGNAFDQVLSLIFYALSRNETEYMKLVKQMDKRAIGKAVEISGLLIKAFCHDYCIWDYLSEVYMQIASLSKSKAFGQFFTPFNVCEMMARIQLGDIKRNIEKATKEKHRISVMEPCVGSGAMLLACKKVIIQNAGLAGLDHFEFFGTDIDHMCIKMSRIQMMLTNYRYMSSLLLSHAIELQEKIRVTNEMQKAGLFYGRLGK